MKKKSSCWFLVERSKKNFVGGKELKEKTTTNNVSAKKVPRSLTNLLKLETDLKKMNVELKKVVKKVKILEVENSKLHKKLDKK